VNILNIKPRPADWRDVVVLFIEVSLAIYVTLQYVNLNDRVSDTLSSCTEYYESNCDCSGIPLYSINGSLINWTWKTESFINEKRKI
jgi:hypothetical protein